MKIRISACSLFVAATSAMLCLAQAESAPLAPPTNVNGNAGQNTPAIAEIEINEPAAPNLQRQVVNYATPAAVGTIIIETAETYLYFVQGSGKAIRYGIGVGRDGFTWSGAQTVTQMAEWPDWTPPKEMIERQPYLPRWMAGGKGNPLGARAIYLGSTVYRIHGTNAPETIGTRVSSGCFRLTNADIADLYDRVKVGTKIIVLQNRDREQQTAGAPANRTAPHIALAPVEPFAISGSPRG